MMRADQNPSSDHGVICTDVPNCGTQGLTDEQYDAQMSRPDSKWRCPVCHGSAIWDDERYDRVSNKAEDQALEDAAIRDYRNILNLPQDALDYRNALDSDPTANILNPQMYVYPECRRKFGIDPNEAAEQSQQDWSEDSSS